MIKRFAPLLITIAVLIAVVAVAAPTIAYYIINANDVADDYTPAEPSDPSFHLDFNNKEMKNVSIGVEDKGYPVYVRVAIIITWQKSAECTNPTECDCSDCSDCIENSGTDDSESTMECPKCNGEVDVFWGQPIEGTDYSISFNTAAWELVDGYYYCTSQVASGQKTGVLINSCALIEGGATDVPEGYVLNVEIIVQTVQAIGSTDSGDVPAWQDAWKKGAGSWN
ncbi:MAG: hypothetical protein J1G02_02885 [Clostridiales bacterium]|nr:hypothetical protein [Clostridiales bacterium]